MTSPEAAVRPAPVTPARDTFITSRRLSRAIIYLLLTVFTFIALAPFVYAVLSAFKTADKILEYPPSFIPNPWTLSNFHDLFSNANIDVHFGRWLFNSFFYALCVMGLNLFFSSMAAFALARLEFRGKVFWFWVTLAVMMIPGEINWISVYIILNHFGPFNLIDTIWAVILPAAAQPFSVFLMTQFLKGLPVEVEEAATIDGASKFRTYWQVMLPMAKPAVVAAGILSFQGTWNAFVGPLLYLNSSTKFPLTVGLNFFNGVYSSHYNLILAGAMFNTIPMVIIFFVFQRYFIQGAATSGLGGR
ncbi:MAG TPA: carbohydrate ABC transporter permease [Chloroflexota bacterium]|nr:carbohydrate ABC transporter permease [Chloroflexota bacterium]